MIASGLACSATAPASAQDADSPGIRWVRKPVWSRVPTEDEILGAYPYRTSKLIEGGSAIIVCQVTSEGALSPCMVRSEDPSLYGFGRSALAVAKFMQMAPRGSDGQPTSGAYVAVPIMFRLPPEQLPPEATLR
ncbi:TonB family protein [Caulobacter sp. ErkDOM-E]|uniref:TonB family protein n=1 Tax=Caulobacter sp. ErkDOM-E TaxID=3402778 RepID=UPI003AF4F297